LVIAMSHRDPERTDDRQKRTQRQLTQTRK
jgi:hypothetical protein